VCIAIDVTGIVDIVHSQNKNKSCCFWE